MIELYQMSERPPKPSKGTEQPKAPIPPAGSDIVFVGPEEEVVSEKVADSLGETWTPEAYEKCKKLFDQILTFANQMNIFVFPAKAGNH